MKFRSIYYPKKSYKRLRAILERLMNDSTCVLQSREDKELIKDILQEVIENEINK